MDVRSARRPSASEPDGYNVSPSAATAPLAPVSSTPRPRMMQTAAVRGRIERLVLVPPDNHQAVSVSAFSRMNVLSRCAPMNSARAIVALSATSRKSTRPAPSAASVSMKNTLAAAPTRAGSPGFVVRHVQPASVTTLSSARPLVSRCEYSTSVAADGDG